MLTRDEWGPGWRESDGYIGNSSGALLTSPFLQHITVSGIVIIARPNSLAWQFADVLAEEAKASTGTAPVDQHHIVYSQSSSFRFVSSSLSYHLQTCGHVLWVWTGMIIL